LTPECSFSVRRASLQHHQLALPESSKVNILWPHSHGCKLTN
jgi:hypothetical protein